MNLLALETSTDACSVALYANGEVLIDHRVEPRKHAQILLPMIEQLFTRAGLTPKTIDGIAFGCGPGSFTGVRIAAATAQGLAFGSGVGVIPVSSLEALAQGAKRLHQATNVLCSFDARMGEVYWGGYECDSKTPMHLVVDELVCPPDAVPLPNNNKSSEWLLVGSGVDQYEKSILDRCNATLSTHHVKDCWPEAQDILAAALPKAQRGEFLPAEEAVPVYLRDRVALTEAERADGQRL